MSIQTGLWDDEVEPTLPKIPGVEAALAAFVPLLFLPFCLAFGWAELAVSFAPNAVKALFTTVCFAAAVHGCLVWPLCGFVFPQYAGRWGLFERTLTTLALFSPPLVSFLYFQAGEGITDFWDLGVTVVPAVALGTFVYEKSQRTWLFSLTLAVAGSLPWLWMGDRLGGFSPVFTYGILNSDGQVLRVVVSCLAVVFGAVTLIRKSNFDETSLRTAGKTLAALAVFHLAMGVVFPFVGLLLGKTSAALSPHWTLVLYPWLILACLRPRALRPRAFTAILALSVLGEVLELGWKLRAVDAQYFELAGDVGGVLSLSLVLGLAYRLRIFIRARP